MGKRFGTNARSMAFVLLLLLGAFFVVAPGTAVTNQAGDHIHEVSSDPAVATTTGHTGAGGALTVPNELSAFWVKRPSAPNNLQASPGDTSIKLTWQVPSKDGGHAITNYKVYRSMTSGEEMLLTTLGKVLNYTDTGLINGQIYYYEVSAVNRGGESPRSGEASATPATPTTVPSAPNLISAMPGKAQVVLVWSAPSSTGSSPITGYKLHRSTTSGGETLLRNLGNVLNYTNTGLTNGQIYYYKVSAINSVGEGPQSNEVSALPISVPAALTFTSVTPSNEQVVLVWAAPSDGGATITNYTIYRGTTSGGETLLVTLGNVLTYTNTGLANGQTYYFKVSAVNSLGEGAQSNEESATPANVPTAPIGLHAVAGDSAVDLNWTAPSYAGPGAITYHLFRDNVLVWSGSALSHIETGLTNGRGYVYKVAASNSVGWGPTSSSMQATPSASSAVPPGAPTNFHVTAGDRVVYLSWSAPANNGSTALLGYRIYRGTSLTSMKFLPTPVTAITHTDTGLTNGQKYYYKVCAYSSAGNGAMTDPLDATPNIGGGGDNTVPYVGIGAIAIVAVTGVAVAMWNVRR